MNLTRRKFLRETALISAFIAASTIFPSALFPKKEELDTKKNKKSNSTDNTKISDNSDLIWHKSPCRFCGTGCGILVGIENGKAIGVKGDPAAEVNKGILCVKGYHQTMCMDASDKITKAKVRKNGQMVEVPLDEALTLVANKMKSTIAQHGKDSVAMYTSGQSTIPEGFIASKLMKGVIGTNNLDCNARLCMASAVTGFMTTFNMDEPMGVFKDIDYADYIITWGNNMSEMHPILFTRMLEEKERRGMKIIDFATRLTRSSMASDKSILFNPQTDLAVANSIAYILIKKNMINSTFIEYNTKFKKGKTNIGYGIEDKFKFEDEVKDSSFEEYKKFLEDYTPEKVSKISGVSIKDIYYLAEIYGNPNNKVTSMWCMGMNQHTRGTWINNLVYNIHLLTGKISIPGSNPTSLTGQPSACGTAREVGTFTHKLPHGLVKNEEDRKMAAKIWKVPYENIPEKPTYHATEMFRALDRGDIKFMWIQATNPMVSLPNVTRFENAAKKSDNFIVVSDCFPTPTTDIADVILPAAWHIEKGGLYGNSERRTQYWQKMVDAQGDCEADAWMFIEVARKMGYGKYFPYKKETHVEEIYNEYRQFHKGKKHNLAPLSVLEKQAGAIWPFVEDEKNPGTGKSTLWRYNSEFDPACKEGRKIDFYGQKDSKAVIWLRPYEEPAESPSKEYPFWLNTGRVIEHWHTGSMTRRIPILHQAVPESYVEINAEDAQSMGIKNDDMIKISSKRGEVTAKAKINFRAMPTRGQVFVPFFDEDIRINRLTLDAFCPISKEPDYKKCACKIEKISNA